MFNSYGIHQWPTKPASQPANKNTNDERVAVTQQSQTSQATYTSTNASNSQTRTILDVPANPNPTCQRLQETFGIDFAAVSAPHAWSSHLDLILERSQLPEDKQFQEKDLVEWALHQITHRLPRGVQHLPRDWSPMEKVLEKLVARYEHLTSPTKTNTIPPPVTILVMGGSVTMGVNCFSPGWRVRSLRCAWPFRLESFLNQMAGFGEIYQRSDDSTKLVKVINKSVGGVNSDVGETILRYEILGPNTYDVIINAYATNDMHINTMQDANKSGADAFGDYIMSIQQEFVRTALSLETSCDNNDRGHHQSPWLLFLNDYLGNEQRSVLATTEGGHGIDLLASYYGFGAISYPDMVRDLVYANTTDPNFSPNLWHPPGKVGMRREIHHTAVFHRIAVFLVSYYAWVATSTYCGLVVWSPDHSVSIRNGLPPRLTKHLVLDTISEEWKNHDRLRRDSVNSPIAVTNISSENPSETPCAALANPRCALSWMSKLNSLSNNNIEEYFAPFVHQPSTTWTVVDQDSKPGWSPPYDGLGQALVLDVPLTKRPVQTVVLFVMKSYGEKWENSTASVEVLQTTSEGTSWESVLGPQFVTGYHGKKTSETYTETLDLSRMLAPPSTLRIRLSLQGGHTFKLMGIAACDAGGDSTHLVSGSRPGFPRQCSIYQRESVVKQLPEQQCNEVAYFEQACSFTKATTKGCTDPHWARETYAKRRRGDDPKFRAVFVDRACTNVQRVADILRVGTHDVQKYSFGGTGCQKNVTYNDSEPPFASESVCITSRPTKELSSAKLSAGITDAELQILSAKTLDDAIDRVGMKNKPIDYLWLEGDVYEFFAPGAADETLSRVRYLEFPIGYEKGSFEELVLQRLTEHNLVCYWSGTNHNLWRITDCWFSHYTTKAWAKVACVSAAHDDARILLERMELVFAETLLKDQVFE
ncbi:unnamed protein product [Pseudo-nitzschia multistriata]|uniref:Uncharacterized protein n=1 Tax=Pseudo-nitzschia multistriata TaxID=183589 RepID=A0A448ZPB2_9STRA|nr:unnamed protein product [Pseudo-nitzschia multistriata]